MSSRPVLRHVTLGAIAVAALTACTEKLAAPPSGLPASLEVVRNVAAESAATDSPFVAGGDSVSVTFTATLSECSDYGAAAGYVGTGLVLTFIETGGRRSCGGVGAVAQLRLAARQVAPGEYTAVLRRRVTGNGASTSIDVTRQVVTLP